MSERIPVVVDADLADLIPAFLANRRRDVDKLRALVAAQAFAEIRLLGHSMKGAGGGYGFDAITDIGAAIEHASLMQNVAAVQHETDRLAEYLTCVDVVFAK